MSRLPAYSVRMPGMEKNAAVSATRDLARAPTARGQACPIDLSVYRCAQPRRGVVAVGISRLRATLPIAGRYRPSDPSHIFREVPYPGCPKEGRTQSYDGDYRKT